MIEGATNIAVAIIAVVAVWTTYRTVREYLFLRGLRPFLPLGEYLPLYESLVSRSAYVAVIGVYLLSLTVVGAVLSALGMPSLAEMFPPIRAINAALLLGLLAGPLLIGRAMRKLPPQ